MPQNFPGSIIPSSGGVIHELTIRTKLIFQLMADPRVNPWAKLVPIAGLIYWISPFDLIFGIPGVDAIDDVAVLWFAQYMFIELCPPEVVLELSNKLHSNNSTFDRVNAQGEDVIDGEVIDVTDKTEK